MTGTYTTDNDYTTREGAQALADKLNAYWHKQGHPMAQHWIEPLALKRVKRSTRSVIWIVKSNLVRGQPPKITSASMPATTTAPASPHQREWITDHDF